MGYSRTIEMGDAFEVSGSIEDAVIFSNVAANYTLGNITMPDITSPIKHVFLDLNLLGYFDNSGAINYIEGGAELVAGFSDITPMTALTLPLRLFYCPAGFAWYPYPGGRLYGNIDVKSKFTAGSVTEVGINDLDAHQDGMWLLGVQPIIRVILA